MKHKALFCVILAMCLLFLAGCVPSKKYFSMKDAGILPTSKDFPNTKWVCQEMDMYFYMMEYGGLIGEYTIDGTTFSIIGNFKFARIVFTAYTDVSTLPTNNGFLADSQIIVNSFGADYAYQDGVIHCTSIDYQMPENATLPTTLTFVPEGRIAQAVEARWYAQEIDMYMDSFTDAEHYFIGVLTESGIEYAFKAFKKTQGDTYNFCFYNAPDQSTDYLYGDLFVEMRLVYDQDQDVMIGTLYEPSFSQHSFADYDGPTITFTKVMPE